MCSGCLSTSSCWAVGQCCWWKLFWRGPSPSARCFSSSPLSTVTRKSNPGISPQTAPCSWSGRGYHKPEDDSWHHLGFTKDCCKFCLSDWCGVENSLRAYQSFQLSVSGLWWAWMNSSHFSSQEKCDIRRPLPMVGSWKLFRGIYVQTTTFDTFLSLWKNIT